MGGSRKRRILINTRKTGGSRPQPPDHHSGGERRRSTSFEHQNHERWLVSYADFITLLFAFFVVMFASTQSDKARAARVSDAVKKAFEDGHSFNTPAAIAKILGGAVDELGPGNIQMKGPGGAFRGNKNVQSEFDLTKPLETLSKKLEEEIKEGKVEVSLAPKGLVVSLKQAAFFPSGTDVIDPATFPVLEKIATTLNKVSNPVRVEGHTDSVPIHAPRFRSNWELSAARSIAMMELLADRFQVSYQRLAIIGYADTLPVSANDTPEGRARNRRVDLVILSDYALAKTEPTQRR